PRKVDEPLDMRDGYLTIELRVNEQHRLPDIVNDPRGLERQHALRPWRIHLLAKLRGHALPPFAAQDRGLNLLLQLDLLRAIGGRRLEPIERVLLLLERELGAGGRRRVNRHDSRDTF